MAAEGAGGGELAQLVADHGLGDVDRHVLAAVVHRDGVPDHLGDDRGATGPGSDDPLLVAAVELVDLVGEMVVDEGALLQGTRHQRRPFFVRRRTMYLLEALLALRVRPSPLPQGLTGWRPPEDFP